MDDATTTAVQPSGLPNNQYGSSNGDTLTQTSDIQSTHEDGDADSSEEEEEEEEEVDDFDDFEDDCECFPSCQFCDAYLNGFADLFDLHWCGCESCYQGALDNPENLLDLGDQLRERELAITDTESIYRAGCKPAHYSNGSHVDYDGCTITQLKMFIRDRRLSSPRSFKVDYIRTLAQADRHPVFRFMDLPAEMRNEIYRYLLILQEVRPGKAFCHPAILETCKEINREGSSILYGENPILCSFAVTSHDNIYQLSRESRVHNTYHSHDRAHFRSGGIPFESITDGLEDFPDFLRRISHIRIHLKFEEGPNTQLHDAGLQKLNNFLANFASALMDEHKLESLEVSVKLQPEGGEEQARLKTATILFPLRRLRDLKHITIDGSVSDVVRAKLSQEVQRPDAAFNTVRCLSKYSKEAQALENLVEDMDMSSRYMVCQCEDCEHDATSPFSLQIGNRREELKQYAVEGFSSTRKELFLRAHLFDFRRWLDRMDIKTLRRNLEKLESAHQARLAAETRNVAHHLSDAAWALDHIDDNGIKETETDFDWN